ncbi:MAG: tRNA pseudouridine(38-40) synthase TruA [Alphaproteobacteria bacterium]
MTRYRLVIEYDGGPFQGWQRQANGLGVQEVLEDAVFAFCGERTRVYGAGRTDAGVHALGQVAHVDIEKQVVGDTVRRALNFHLKAHPVSVLEAQAVAEDFHARFDAVRRRYLYRILNRGPAPTLDLNRVWHVPVPLDAPAMHAAAQHLLGEHDFTTFRAQMCQARSPVKTLDRLDVRQEGDEIRITAEARSFLHHQVRNLVGTLRLVGEGKWTAADLRAALVARDRAAGGPTAPPWGLYLVSVDYA